MITLTETARQRLKDISSENDNKLTRLDVVGGGCAGFEYRWSNITKEDVEEDDIIIEDLLVTSKQYELYLLGTTLDYKKDPFVSQFTIENPMAKNSCGCGTSFSV